jgi:hypothetical protein
MENQTQYYCWQKDENSVRAFDGRNTVECHYYPNRKVSSIELHKIAYDNWSENWQPTTREVFEATRAKVLELLRKEGAI